METQNPTDLPEDLHNSYRNFMFHTAKHVGWDQASIIWWQYWKLNFAPEVVQRHFSGHPFYENLRLRKDFEYGV